MVLAQWVIKINSDIYKTNYIIIGNLINIACNTKIFYNVWYLPSQVTLRRCYLSQSAVREVAMRSTLMLHLHLNRRVDAPHTTFTLARVRL